KKPEEIDEKSVARFVLGCKDVFNSISFDEIKEIREKISKVIEEAGEKKKRRGEGDVGCGKGEVVKEDGCSGGDCGCGEKKKRRGEGDGR
ncbi:MAG: hypothetical protein ABIH92_00005, partial [Nanoarchaeota archaeon]